MRPARLVMAAVALAVGLTAPGCGGDSSAPAKRPDAKAAERGLSAGDLRALDDVRAHITVWNRASANFVRAYKAGDVQRLERVGPDYARAMSAAYRSMYERVLTIENADVRSVYLKLVANYHDKLDAFDGLLAAVRDADVAARRRHERALNRAGREAQRLAEPLLAALRARLSGKQIEALFRG